MATLNVKKFPDGLYRRIQEMAARKHRSIAQQVIHLLTEATEDAEERSILELRGLGKEIWEGTDAAEHVREERASWDS